MMGHLVPNRSRVQCVVIVTSPSVSAPYGLARAVAGQVERRTSPAATTSCDRPVPDSRQPVRQVRVQFSGVQFAIDRVLVPVRWGVGIGGHDPSPVLDPVRDLGQIVERANAHVGHKGVAVARTDLLLGDPSAMPATSLTICAESVPRLRRRRGCGELVHLPCHDLDVAADAIGHRLQKRAKTSARAWRSVSPKSVPRASGSWSGVRSPSK